MRSYFECPFCGTHKMPEYEYSISTAGWIVFILLLFGCFPICWIGLLIRDAKSVCVRCRVALD
jgi:hypothetical protein